MQALRVLFVDDSDLDVMLAVRVLRAAAYEVFHTRVERADDMARELEDGVWDIVICDHKMPEFDALSALRLHTRLACPAPFLIVSGAMPDELVIDAMREGARDFLDKGNLTRLVPAVERELKNARDRSLLGQMQDSVNRLLYSDLLTGIGNQDALVQHLGAELSEAKRLALVLVDIDRFRRLTRRLGMVAANRILRVTAMRLNGVIEARQGFIARMGFDRFGMVLPLAGDCAGLDELAGAIEQALQAPVTLDGQSFRLTAGLAAALAPEHAQQADRLIKCAEAALLNAKRAAGQRLVVFEPGMGAEIRDRSLLDHALLRAAEQGQFVLHYQPRVELCDGRPQGVEALLRWQSPERGLVLPEDFVPLLEDAGLMVTIGRWVLREAFAQMKRWQDDGLGRYRMSINLSPAELRQPDLAVMVGQLLLEAGISAAAVEFEIVDGSVVGNEEESIATLSALRALGCTVAIDDYGSGYSSLAYLQHFPVDCLKIAPDFVRGDAANDGTGIVRAIVAIGEGLALGTTAEGVETAEQSERMRIAGCRRAQGFHFSKPMPADQATEYLKRWN